MKTPSQFEKLLSGRKIEERDGLLFARVDVTSKSPLQVFERDEKTPSPATYYAEIAQRTGQDNPKHPLPVQHFLFRATVPDIGYPAAVETQAIYEFRRANPTVVTLAALYLFTEFDEKIPFGVTFQGSHIPTRIGATYQSQMEDGLLVATFKTFFADGGLKGTTQARLSPEIKMKELAQLFSGEAVK